jgi:hypothetical protein
MEQGQKHSVLTQTSYFLKVLPFQLGPFDAEFHSASNLSNYGANTSRWTNISDD